MERLYFDIFFYKGVTKSFSKTGQTSTKGPGKIYLFGSLNVIRSFKVKTEIDFICSRDIKSKDKFDLRPWIVVWDYK